MRRGHDLRPSLRRNARSAKSHPRGLCGNHAERVQAQVQVPQGRNGYSALPISLGQKQSTTAMAAARGPSSGPARRSIVFVGLRASPPDWCANRAALRSAGTSGLWRVRMHAYCRSRRLGRCRALIPTGGAGCNGGWAGRESWPMGRICTKAQPSRDSLTQLRQWKRFP
jgi:hypothetical protein